MSTTKYGFEKQLSGTTVEQARGRVVDALKNEGFGVLTEIDVKQILKQKLDLEFRDYLILGACNPQLASKALNEEAQIGLLLPCNLVLQDAGDGNVTVSIADPKSIFQLVENQAVQPVAAEADARLRRVLAAL